MTKYQEKVMEVRDKLHYLIRETNDFEKFRYKGELLFFIGMRNPEYEDPVLFEISDEIDNLIKEMENDKNKELGKWIWM